MWIKVYENRETSKSYIIRQLPGDPLSPYIENENHQLFQVTENELYQVLDKLFKDKIAAGQRERDAGL